MPMPPMRHAFKVVALTVTSALLSACGGGGDGPHDTPPSAVQPLRFESPAGSKLAKVTGLPTGIWAAGTYEMFDCRDTRQRPEEKPIAGKRFLRLGDDGRIGWLGDDKRLITEFVSNDNLPQRRRVRVEEYTSYFNVHSRDNGEVDIRFEQGDHLSVEVTKDGTTVVSEECHETRALVAGRAPSTKVLARLGSAAALSGPTGVAFHNVITGTSSPLLELAYVSVDVDGRIVTQANPDEPRLDWGLQWMERTPESNWSSYRYEEHWLGLAEQGLGSPSNPKVSITLRHNLIGSGNHLVLLRKSADEGVGLVAGRLD